MEHFPFPCHERETCPLVHEAQLLLICPSCFRNLILVSELVDLIYNSWNMGDFERCA